ncbi:MAG: 3'(2'),5'-bisphosphate nucleotidase [Prochlorotrichaceae cyanobacterium]|jgi:3'(2'), 5'-bisphosphate nucleotidase
MRAYSKEREIALQATIAAAQFCEKVRQDQASQAFDKPDHSPVTVADYGAQALICNALKTMFPTDRVVGEEDPQILNSPGMKPCLAQVTHYLQAWVEGVTPLDVLDWVGYGQGKTGQRFWTLDPIDGTKGYVRGDQYAIALALIEDGVVQLGVMACPALPLQFGEEAQSGAPSTGAVFVAVRGQGAEILNLEDGQRSPLTVNPLSTPQGFQLIESVERDHGTPQWQHRVIQSLGWHLLPLQMDSLAKYGAIARGEADLYLRLPTGESLNRRENIWDHAAGTIVLEEAGGKVTDQWGNPLNFSRGIKLQDNEGIVASNGHIHQAVLEAIQNTR